MVMQTGQTYAEKTAERQAKRAHLCRMAANEKTKLPRLNDQLKAHAADVTAFRKRDAVLTRHAGQGEPEARLRLPTARDQLASAEGLYESDQKALAGVNERIAAYEAEIARMDAEKVDTAADKQELADVLGEIRSERGDTATRAAALQREGAKMATALAEERSSFWRRLTQG